MGVGRSRKGWVQGGRGGYKGEGPGGRGKDRVEGGRGGCKGNGAGRNLSSRRVSVM